MDEQAVEAKQEAASAGAALAGKIGANLRRVIHAPDETLDFAVLCLLSEGHLIIEDFPGVGKTTLAKALARSVDCSFSRLQFTPDLLPSDVTGVNVFNQRSNEFESGPGRCSPTSCSSTRSTAPRRRPRRRCSSACRNVR